MSPRLLLLLTSLLALLAGAPAHALASTAAGAQNCARAPLSADHTHALATTGESACTRPGSNLGPARIAAGCCVAAEAEIGGAKFAQTSFSENFSKGGLFEGKTIDDVAGALKSGSMSAKDVPIKVVVRDGNTLILNTRSAQALTRAGVPRSSWNVVNRTGNMFYEGLLSGQLRRNGLGSAGTDLP